MARLTKLDHEAKSVSMATMEYMAAGVSNEDALASKGDLVLSQKGKLLGMMANNDYCYVITSLKSESSITFRKDLNRTTIAKTLKAHNATIQRKAFDLR
mgnify:CR=1 FL=1